MATPHGPAAAVIVLLVLVAVSWLVLTVVSWRLR